ncbi:exported hypothetical protein [uncultured Desulfatiglans sp.]|uniref:Uncharacterized protein n=1 Tax=Uncultured Desulfatiglans sp. TaxID=1748965 RepID=A0A653AA91_UNCDX|nr:exported hypothetical protein [uncultured Desulfatiglans sp.]
MSARRSSISPMCAFNLAARVSWIPLCAASSSKNASPAGVFPFLTASVVCGGLGAASPCGYDRIFAVVPMSAASFKLRFYAQGQDSRAAHPLERGYPGPALMEHGIEERIFKKLLQRPSVFSGRDTARIIP